MSELRKANTDLPYFLTFTVVGWIDIFTRDRYSRTIIKSLKHCQKHKGLEIYAFVIMTSHIHLIGRSLDSKLSDIIRDFKSYTATKIIKQIEEGHAESRKDWLLHMFKYYAKYQKQNVNYQFWQKNNHAIECYHPSVIDQKIDYIHNNPVEAGYVEEPSNWIYSSASNNNLLELPRT